MKRLFVQLLGDADGRLKSAAACPAGRVAATIMDSDGVASLTPVSSSSWISRKPATTATRPAITRASETPHGAVDETSYRGDRRAMQANLYRCPNVRSKNHRPIE